MEEEVVETVEATDTPVAVEHGTVVEETPQQESVTLEQRVAEIEALSEEETAKALKDMEAQIAALRESIKAFEEFNAQLALANRVKALEEAAPATTNEKLEALVAKMHEKMKLLISMD